MAGKVDDIAPIATGFLAFIDQDLDPTQREAVARSVFTPDVFLLEAVPGIGRSRVVAEILNQALARGEKALLLANCSTALDSVLSRLVQKEHAGAVVELAEIHQAIQALRPLVEAKQRGRWWTFTWWQAVLRGQVAARLAELEGRQQALEANGPFDLLVVDEADQFSEADLLRVSRQAARVVLVGDTQGTAAKPHSGCFQKLWQSMHGDEPVLPYSWSWENNRLCCSLRRMQNQDQADLEIERLVDFPEIERGILAIPKAAPLLAQVVFPAGMTILQAKAFIYRELEEVAVQGLGRGLAGRRNESVPVPPGPSTARRNRALGP